jgi:hypothetical protein
VTGPAPVVSPSAQDAAPRLAHAASRAALDLRGELGERASERARAQARKEIDPIPGPTSGGPDSAPARPN